MPMTYLAVEFPSQCLTCRPYSCMSWPTNTDRMLLLFTRASWDPSPVCQGGQSLIQQRRAHRASNSFWTTYSGSQFNVIIPSLILSLRHQDQNKLHSRSCLLTSSAFGTSVKYSLAVTQVKVSESELSKWRYLIRSADDFEAEAYNSANQNKRDWLSTTTLTVQPSSCHVSITGDRKSVV